MESKIARLQQLNRKLDDLLQFVTGPFALKNGQVLRVSRPIHQGMIVPRAERRISIEDPAQHSTLIYRRTGKKRAALDMIASRKSATVPERRSSLKKSWGTLADHLDRRKIVTTTDAMGLEGASAHLRARQYSKLGGFQRLRRPGEGRVRSTLPGVEMIRLPSALRGRK